MRFLITAGPTREYIDSVRFISNGSSGRMGIAVARAAVAAGHSVTLLLGVGVSDAAHAAGLAEMCDIVEFVSVADLQRELSGRFAECDVLVMSAAVGDYTVAQRSATKLSRADGAITLRLEPSQDVLAGVAGGKRGDQTIVAFAVEDGEGDAIITKARRELVAKNADLDVVNTPAAMGGKESLACIISRQEVLLGWDTRPKEDLAAEIIRIIESFRPREE